MAEITEEGGEYAGEAGGKVWDGVEDEGVKVEEEVDWD